MFTKCCEFFFSPPTLGLIPQKMGNNSEEKPNLADPILRQPPNLPKAPAGASEHQLMLSDFILSK